MNVRKPYNTAQAMIFVGLLVSGAMLAISLGGGDKRWVVPGGYLGWLFSVLSAVVYIVALPLAIYRDASRQFWCSWIPLNFGLTFYGATLTFTKVEEPIVLSWLSFLGVGIAVILYRWHGIASRYVLILVNMVLFAPTLPFLERYWELLVLPLTTTLVIVPILYAARDCAPISPETSAAAQSALADPPR